MPSIYELNQPPNPIWDFLTHLDNQGRRPNYPSREDRTQQTGEESPSDPGPSQPGRSQRPNCPDSQNWGWGPGFGSGYPFHGACPPFGNWGGNPFVPKGHAWGGGGGSPAGPGTFNLGQMIQNLATQFGIPLAQAGQAEQPQHKSQTDFTPPIDIIDTPTGYTIHVSLPGAKKEDLSIEYDEAESVLRIAGVVYRPGLDEEMHKGLVVQERSGEVGVFERDVVLGTRASPAGVVVDAIGARLEDGVLRVTVPKVGEREKKAGKKVVVEDEMENEKMDESDGKEFVRVDVQ